MYNRVLVPLDGSQLSECSLQHVKSTITEGHRTDVILLRVIEPLLSNDAAVWAQAGYTVTEVEKKHKKDAEEYLKQIAEMLSRAGVIARIEVVFGRAAEAIMEYASEHKVDLIIISTHGRSGISRLAFGSVAEKVVHNTDIPVLLVTAPGCRTKKK